MELVYVSDLNKSLRDKIFKDFGVKTYDQVEEMLDKEQLDAVSIATPDCYHVEPAMAAIRHGKYD